MENFLRILKAISDESRLRILNLILSAEEICVCDIERTLGFTQTKVSRHLTILKGAGLVNDRRQGLWILYTYIGDTTAAHRRVLRGLEDVFSSTPVFRDDVRRLQEAVKNGKCKTFNVIHPDRSIKIHRLRGGA